MTGKFCIRGRFVYSIKHTSRHLSAGIKLSKGEKRAEKLAKRQFANKRTVPRDLRGNN